MSNVIKFRHKGKCEFVGAYLPQQLVQKLRKRSIHTGISLSGLLEEALTLAMRNEKNEKTKRTNKKARKQGTKTKA